MEENKGGARLRKNGAAVSGAGAEAAEKTAAKEASKASAKAEKAAAKAEKTGSPVPGYAVAGITAVISAVFAFIVYRTGVLPGKFFALLCAGLAILTGLLWLMTAATKHPVRLAIGIVLALAVCAGLIYGGWMIHKGVSTVQEGMGTVVETTDMSVYVRADDPAETPQDAAGYTFGILSVLDRANTDEAIAYLEEELGVTLNIREYDMVEDLADALTNGEIDGFILNDGFIGLFEDIDGYTDIPDALRTLETLTIETQLEHDGTGSKSNNTAAETAAPTEPAETEEVPAENPDAAPGEEVDADSEVISPEEAGGQIKTDTVEKEEGVFILYVSGIDTSGAVTNRSRSDVNILCTVNTNTKQILLVHIPRDYWVYTPVSGDARDKLTNAGIYGIDCSMGAMEMLFGIEADYYFRVNFTSLIRIVDALGGITAYSDQSFTAMGQYEIVQGYNTMNGEKALAFARDRHHVNGGDRGRGRHQMEIIKACIKKACSPTLLTNYSKILASVEDAYQTSVPYELIAELVKEQLESGTEWEMFSMSVDGGNSMNKAYSQKLYTYCMIPDQETVDKAADLMARICRGETITSDDVS